MDFQSMTFFNAWKNYEVKGYTVYRKLFFIISIVLLSFNGYAQTACDCPTLTECKECKGGINSLTLKYNGSVAALITVRDDDEIIFSGFLAPGAVFTFSGEGGNGKFDDDEVEIRINSVVNTIIDVTCSLELDPAEARGKFYLLAAESKINGPLCCTTSAIDEKPIITGCPSDIISSTTTTTCSQNVLWTAPQASDCNLKSFVSNKNSGDSFPLGITIVTYTATDENNNTATCSFKVTVEDKTPPGLSNCPLSITLPSDVTCQAKAIWTPPSATDNCSSVTLTGSHTSGSLFPIGTTTVTYTGKDLVGNVTLCTFNVIVKDQTGPVVSNCPSNLTLNGDANCKAQATWTPPTFIDCSTQTITSSHVSGSDFPLGTTAVTYAAKDGFGNTTICAFNIVVKDNTAPTVVACPQEINASADQSCQAKITWVAPNFTDNCSSTTVISTHKPNDIFPTGTTPVTYTATDNAGNITRCTFNVNVKDAQDPVIVGCPEDITMSTILDRPIVINWQAPTASDDCSLESLQSTHSPGQSFPSGSTTVTYTATDKSGRTTSCNFIILIESINIDLDFEKIIAPNGNGDQGKWNIGNIDKYESNKVVIVDRWGSVVYRAADYDNNKTVWDGQTNGTALPTGTYFYSVSVLLGSSWIEEKGFIELVR